MKLLRKVGSTSQILQVFIQSTAVTTGAGLTGLAFGTASLTAYYHRDTDTTATAITLVDMTIGTFTSSGFKEIDSVNMPGWYQFCPPDAALASGAKSVGFALKGAANMAQLPIEIDLDGQVDVTFWNGTVVASPATAGIPEVNVKNINNTAAATPGASGGILISGSNSGTTTFGAMTVTGVLTATGGIVGNITGNLSGSVGSVTGLTASDVGNIKTKTDFLPSATAGAAGGVFIAGSNAATTVNITGNITGNLSGSVGSVTGLTASNLDATVSSRATPADILTTALTESYAADGAAPTLAQALFLTMQTLSEFAISGTTITVNGLDGTTPVATYTLDSGVIPTSRTRAT